MEPQEKLGISEDYSFEVAMQALSEGQPICFGCCEGDWVNFALSDGPIFFWRAQTTGDLNEMKTMIKITLTTCRAWRKDWRKQGVSCSSGVNSSTVPGSRRASVS